LSLFNNSPVVPYIFYGGSVINFNQTNPDWLKNGSYDPSARAVQLASRYPFNDAAVPTCSAFLDYANTWTSDSDQARLNMSEFLREHDFNDLHYLDGYQFGLCRFFQDYDHDKMRGGAGNQKPDPEFTIYSYDKDNKWKDSPDFFDLDQFIEDISYEDGGTYNFIYPTDRLFYEPLFLRIAMDLRNVASSLISDDENLNLSVNIDSVICDPTMPEPNENFDVEVAISNNGSNQIENALIEIYLDNVKVSQTTRSINSKATITETFSLSADKGNHIACCKVSLGGAETTTVQKENFFLVGYPGVLKINGESTPSVMGYQASPGADVELEIQIQNEGDVDIRDLNISPYGDISSWITLPVSSSIILLAKQGVLYRFNLSIPSNAELDIHQGGLQFSYDSGVNSLTLPINIQVYNSSTGGDEELLSPSTAHIDGTSDGVIRAEYFSDVILNDYDNHNWEHQFGLDVSEYNRLQSFIWRCGFRKIDTPDSQYLLFKVNGNAAANSAPAQYYDPNELISLGSDGDGIDISNRVHDGNNVLLIGPNAATHDNGFDFWKIENNRINYSCCKSVWIGDRNVTATELQTWKDGWGRCEIRAVVNSVGTEGDVHLYNNGDKIETESIASNHVGDTISWYIEKTQLDEINHFALKGDAGDDTIVDLSNISFFIEFYEGDPLLHAHKSISPEMIIVGETATVTVEIVNDGSNLADVEFVDTLPAGTSLIDDSLSGSSNNLRPGEIITNSYKIKFSEVGFYNLGATSVDYDSEAGDIFSTKSNYLGVNVNGGDLNAQILTPSEELFAGDAVVLLAAVNDQTAMPVIDAIVKCTIKDIYGNLNEKMMLWNDSLELYQTTLVNTAVSGYYDITVSAEKAFFASAITDPVRLYISSQTGVGDLTVDLLPVELNAQWSLDSGAWVEGSGDVAGLPCGLHRIDFGSIAGYHTPPFILLNISPDQVSTVNVEYIMVDTDWDGLGDMIEQSGCTSPTNPDTDGDGLFDGIEDANHNGQQDEGETDPCSFDTDEDWLSDYQEVHNNTTDPLNPDMDEDGLLDGQEDVNRNGKIDCWETDPLTYDTDGDGISDYNDNSPHYPNPSQEDENGDGIGDACFPLWFQGSCELFGEETGIYSIIDLRVKGNFVYIWGDNSKLIAIDLTDSRNPVVASSIDFEMFYDSHISIDGNTAYINCPDYADGELKTISVDISNPYDLHIIEELNEIIYIPGFCVLDRSLYDTPEFNHILNFKCDDMFEALYFTAECCCLSLPVPDPLCIEELVNICGWSYEDACRECEIMACDSGCPGGYSIPNPDIFNFEVPFFSGVITKNQNPDFYNSYPFDDLRGVITDNNNSLTLLKGSFITDLEYDFFVFGGCWYNEYPGYESWEGNCNMLNGCGIHPLEYYDAFYREYGTGSGYHISELLYDSNQDMIYDFLGTEETNTIYSVTKDDGTGYYIYLDTVRFQASSYSFGRAGGLPSCHSIAFSGSRAVLANSSSVDIYEGLSEPEPSRLVVTGLNEIIYSSQNLFSGNNRLLLKVGDELLVFAFPEETIDGNEEAKNFLLDGETFSIGENDQRNINFCLKNAPLTKVTVNVNYFSGDQDIIIKGEDQFVFTPDNYNQYQTVTFVAKNDTDTENGSVTFQLCASGIMPYNLVINEIEDDIIPEINEITSESGVAGDTITINGVFFGEQQSSGRVVFFDNVDAEIVSWSDSSIVCYVPEGAQDGPVVVETDYGSSNGVDFHIGQNMIEFYLDNDDDGYGDPTISIFAVVQPSGYVINSSDSDEIRYLLIT